VGTLALVNRGCNLVFSFYSLRRFRVLGVSAVIGF
jgi:hypothetical protein